MLVCGHAGARGALAHRCTSYWNINNFIIFIATVDRYGLCSMKVLNKDKW